MPVTTYPAPHGASLIETDSEYASTSDDLLQRCSYAEHKHCTGIIQSSFGNLEPEITGSQNGFVHTVIEAYNHHHHLRIRPDDVWLTILAQLNIYINTHSEALWYKFVAHDGQKELTIIDIGSADTYDWGNFAQQMTTLIEKNIIDADLRKWIIPNFTTTSEKDRTICSIMMMATLQKYFSHKSVLKCGLPSVTLLGERADWVSILSRLEKLKTLGAEAVEWYNLLVPVLNVFIDTFDKPDSHKIKDAWQKIAHQYGGGSGPT